jgi:hypothetical protein
MLLNSPLLHLTAVIALASLICANNAEIGGKRFAFVTLHYEGTKNDAEYILGIRVLLASLRGTPYPFIILASDSVSQHSRELFTSEGATVVPVSASLLIRHTFSSDSSHSETHCET